MNIIYLKTVQNVYRSNFTCTLDMSLLIMQYIDTHESQTSECV